MEINKPVATIIILIISLILIFLFIVPKFQESNDLQKNLVQKQAEYNGQSVYYARISDLLSEIEKRKDVLGKINSALPSNLSLASLVYFLQKKGNETGLIVKSVTFSQVLPSAKGQNPTSNSGKEVKNVSFTIDLLGNYQGLKNFLSAMDKSARLFEVNTISFNSVQSLQGSVQGQNQLQVYNFKLEVKTHTY